MLTKKELLEPLARRRTNEVVVTSMGVVRPWAEYSDNGLDFASADSAMGHAADLALGIAIAQPSRRVICLNGDGSMLMSLGTLATVVEVGVDNFVLFVIVNGVYEITGSQPIPAGRLVDFAVMARAAGFARAYKFTAAADYETGLAEILTEPGPTLVSVAVEPGTEGPISRGPHESARYLQVSLAESARTLRRALTGEGGR